LKILDYICVSIIETIEDNINVQIINYKGIQNFLLVKILIELEY